MKNDNYFRINKCIIGYLLYLIFLIIGFFLIPDIKLMLGIASLMIAMIIYVNLYFKKQ